LENLSFHCLKNDFKIKTAVTIGSFDGIHIGHRFIIDKLKNIAAEMELKSLVVTFLPHPAAVLHDAGFKLILSEEEKLAKLAETGVDYLLRLPFDESFAALSPAEFITDVLIKRLNVAAVVAGEGFRFGRGGTGRAADITAAGLDFVGVPLVSDAEPGGKISSTAIRELIRARDFASAERLLGGKFFVMGKVQPGRAVGRLLGFPTLNITANADKLLPPDGVYATATTRKGKRYKSITNIGTRPTFGDGVKNIETFLMDFNETVYGENVTVEFVTWLRDEKKFANADELIKQINIDIKRMGALK